MKIGHKVLAAENPTSEKQSDLNGAEATEIKLPLEN